MKEVEGRRREGKGREGKGRQGKSREGKAREDHRPSVDFRFFPWKLNLRDTSIVTCSDVAP